MPSSIPGYEYDIFISYRQKDNLYDSWVTEFILNLRKELEATFKEDIYIYTDENKYDGLQEVHHVDESLSSKLKCLIFIPIISQTYGDPNSYAWKNELLIFNERASKDRFGLKIKLPNGNVTSRIVPVQIHDLDPQDMSFIENAIGGPLRSINFIFKAPGVNRPLRANEDHPHDNQDKTYYRDQINKVANLIKEIILSLKSPDRETYSATTEHDKVSTSSKFSKQSKRIVLSTLVVVTLALLLYYFTRGSVDGNFNAGDGRIAIAVLPFKAIGAEEESQYLADGVMEVILSNLTIFPELKVKSGTTVEKYRHDKKSIPEIAGELKVIYILIGSAQKLGDNIRIVVQLIDARTDNNVWSQAFEKKFSNVFEIQNQISAAVATSLKARLTPDITGRMSKPATTSFEGYDLFLRAKQLGKKYANTTDVRDLESAISLLERALIKDDHFALGFAWLAGLKALKELDRITDQNVKDSILLLADRALELDSTIVESYLVLSQVYNYVLDDINALRFTYKALVAESGDSITSKVELIRRLGSIYARLGDLDRASWLYDEIIAITPGDLDVLHDKFYALAASKSLDKLVRLSEQIKAVDPNDVFVDIIMTHVLTEQKDFKSLESIYRKKNRTSNELIELDQYIFIYAYALRKNGNEAEAVKLITKFEKLISKNNSWLRAQILLFNGRQDQALGLLAKADIGWYNLTMCLINPVFESVMTDARFKSFLQRNTDRTRDLRERIYLLENKGYLPKPEVFFQKGG